jgi:tRNA-specific 2-thiouridylase
VQRDDKDRRVVVGLSGGVDSAVAAALLLAAGFHVEGVILQLWQAPFTAAPSDSVARARDIAQQLDIPLHPLDYRERFYEDVVTPFLDAYAEGLTPNPCVYCNPTFKFNALREAADRFDAHWIATGHYARLARSADGPTRLLRAVSPARDQSYMLYRLPQPILRRLRLPLGTHADKAAIRALARRFDLVVADHPDSQDLCFLNGGNYRELLARRRPEALAPGPIVDESGHVLGEHQGLPRYTVGQRSGLNVAANERLYVLALRPADNTLVVGPAERLLRDQCTLYNVTFPTGEAPADVFTAQARVRYRAPLVETEVTLLKEARASVCFAEPQRAPAPGQSVVFYREEEVIGGGMISRTAPRSRLPDTPIKRQNQNTESA